MKTQKTPKNYRDVLIAFRALEVDRAELDEISRRWQLNPAEVARRAFREGLAIVKKIELPGTRLVEKQPRPKKGKLQETDLSN
jgi:hypothetical protein